GNGNITSLSDGVNASLSATYGYDTLDRLTSMSGLGSFGYDTVGNLITKPNPSAQAVTQTYGGTGLPGPPALAPSAGTTYNYDRNGNVSSTSAGLTLTWNAENMAMRQVQSGVDLKKSFLGEAVWKKVETTPTTTTTYYLPSLRIENGQPRKFF